MHSARSAHYLLICQYHLKTNNNESVELNIPFVNRAVGGYSTHCSLVLDAGVVVYFIYSKMPTKQ